MTGVMQDWVAGLPLKEQGVIVLALRGPDGVVKEHPSKNIVRSLRGSVMVPSSFGRPLIPGEHWEGDNFMELFRVGNLDPTMWATEVRKFFGCWDELNVHFLLHLMHAAQVLGYRHPHPLIGERWTRFYLKCVQKCHLNPETFDEMARRLGPEQNGETTHA